MAGDDGELGRGRPCSRRLVAAGFLGALAGGGRPRWRSVAAGARRTVPIRAAREDGPSALGREIEALLADEGGLYGVAVAGPAGHLVYGRNTHLPFVAASLFKLPVMAAVHALDAAGLLSLDEGILVENLGWTTVRGALEAMITVSSNEAAFALVDRVGVDAVNRTAADLGLAHSRLGLDPKALAGWPLPRSGHLGGAPAATAADRAVAFVELAAPVANGRPDVTTPADVAAFFALLLGGGVVDRRRSKQMLRLLGRQTIADRFPALLPAGTKLAHKTGNLPGVVHDAGVLAAPAGPVVLVALAQDMPDEARAAVVLQRLALVVYRHHGGAACLPPFTVPRRDRAWAAAPVLPRRSAPLTGAAGTTRGC